METPIAVTVGDPAGVGPEVLRRAIEDLGPVAAFRLYGPGPIVTDLAARYAWCTPAPTSRGLDGVQPGRYTEASGRASVAALEAAIRDFSRAEVRALVTGPISKRALSDARLRYPGQTEWVADATGASRVAMMLFGPVLRVTLATTHLPLQEVARALTSESIRAAAELTKDFLHRVLGVERPRIGVLGLNPHASDDGRFGDEEARVIRPAVQDLQARGFDVAGPLPADTAFYRAFRAEFDALIAMYHDQGLGPLKLVHFEEAVNVTLGLPRLRCSPDHGPAYDLVAGHQAASHASMREALKLAVRAAG